MTVQSDFRAIYFAILILFGATACSQSESDNSDQLQAGAYLDVAELYYNQGQFRAAVIEAQNALQVLPGNENTGRFISRLYIDLGNLAAASEVLQQLLAQNPDDIEASLLLAESYLGSGDQNLALEILEPLQTETSEQAAQRYWLLGNVYARNNNQTAAYEAMQSAVQLDPAHMDSLIGLSMLEFQGGNEFGAQEYLDQAIAADPNHLDLWMWRGQFALLREQYLESEEAFSAALQIMGEYDTMTPKRLIALQAIIIPLQMQQKNDQALRYSQILAETPQGQLQSSFNSAFSLFQEGNLEQAGVMIDEVLALAPDHPGSNILRGIMQYSQGNFQGAQESLTGLVNAETSSPEVIKILAATHLRMNQPERALSVLEEAAETYPSDGSLLAMIGISQQGMGDIEQSIDTFNRAIELQSESPDLHFALARSYFTLGDIDSVIEQLDRTLTLDSNYTLAKTALVDIYFAQENPEMAEAVVAQWLELDSESVDNNNLAGRVAYRRGDLTAARQFFAISLETDSSIADTRLYLATIDVAENNYSEAEAHLLEVLRAEPGNLSAISGLLALGDLSQSQNLQISRIEQLVDEQTAEFAPPLVLSQYYLNQGELGSALSNAQLAYARNVNPITENGLIAVLLQQVNLALQQEDIESAREAVNYALEIQAENLQVLVVAAGIEAQDGEYSGAREHLNRIRDLRPEGSNIGFEVEGDYLFAQDEYESALAIYREAWDIAASPSLGVKINRTLTAMDQLDAAFEFLQQWDAQFPADPVANMLLGMSYQDENREDDAIRHYEVVMESQSGNMIVLNNLAWLYQDSNPERALELSARAAELFPQNADVLDTHGWILHKQNKSTEAVEVLTRAQELAPANRSISEHLEAARQ